MADAVREQNAEVAVGQLGQPPARLGQTAQVPLSVQGRLPNAEAFANIILKTASPSALLRASREKVAGVKDSAVVRLKDVARLELGAKNEDISCHLDGRAASSVSI